MCGGEVEFETAFGSLILNAEDAKVYAKDAEYFCCLLTHSVEDRSLDN